MELRTGVMLGVEGLIRPISPAPFADPKSLFEAAATSGHLLSLELACVETIVAGAAGLARGPFLSINLSPATLEAPEFSTAALLNILSRHSFPPERLVIELTEQQPVTDIEKIRLKLETCRAAGMRVAADDVGSGNAGLRLLAELNFDIIKVDLTLVQRSASSAASSAVVGSVVSLGRPHGGDGGRPKGSSTPSSSSSSTSWGYRRPGLPARPARIAARAGGADRRRDPLSVARRRKPALPACPPGASRSACRSPRDRAARRRRRPARPPARPVGGGAISRVQPDDAAIATEPGHLALGVLPDAARRTRPPAPCPTPPPARGTLRGSRGRSAARSSGP